MNNSNYWLEVLRAENKALKTDSALAAAIGVSRSAISQHKTGRYTLGTKTAIMVADMLEIHPMLVLASVQYDATRTVEDARFWLSQWIKWEHKLPAAYSPPISTGHHIGNVNHYDPGTGGWELAPGQDPGDDPTSTR